MCEWMDRHTDRQAYLMAMLRTPSVRLEMTDRKTNRQIDRQTDRQTGRN